MSKQRQYVVIQDGPYVKDSSIVVKSVIGLRSGVPWREIACYSGARLISYHSKGDFRDFRDHGVIE